MNTIYYYWVSLLFTAWLVLHDSANSVWCCNWIEYLASQYGKSRADQEEYIVGYANRDTITAGTLKQTRHWWNYSAALWHHDQTEMDCRELRICFSSAFTPFLSFLSLLCRAVSCFRRMWYISHFSYILLVVVITYNSKPMRCQIRGNKFIRPVLLCSFVTIPPPSLRSLCWRLTEGIWLESRWPSCASMLDIMRAGSSGYEYGLIRPLWGSEWHR